MFSWEIQLLNFSFERKVLLTSMDKLSRFFWVPSSTRTADVYPGSGFSFSFCLHWVTFWCLTSYHILKPKKHTKTLETSLGTQKYPQILFLASHMKPLRWLTEEGQARQILHVVPEVRTPHLGVVASVTRVATATGDHGDGWCGKWMNMDLSHWGSLLVLENGKTVSCWSVNSNAGRGWRVP